MVRLNLQKKTGFWSMKPVTIYEKRPDRYEIFYSRNAYDFVFNLPPGIYYTDCFFKKLSSPVKYVLPALSEPTGSNTIPKNIRIIRKKNPNICSVYPEIGLIVMDPKLSKYPLPSIIHVLFHEIGHYFYDDNEDPEMENKCDNFASYYMIKMGYNPSQCLEALKKNLKGTTATQRNVAHYRFIKNIYHG